MADDGEEGTPGYKVSDKVDIKDIMNQDTEDESLRRYKESLLGAALNEDVSPKDDPRRVVIKKMTIVCENRPGGDIVFDLEEKGSENKMKETPFILQENAKYKTKITFKVQHEIVSGLKLVNIVKKKGIKVATDTEMLGSFPPQKDYHEIVFPRHGWEEAPSGMIARGKYGGRHRFVDDDQQCHLEYDYAFQIAKTWEAK